jgi:hypothetical protein
MTAAQPAERGTEWRSGTVLTPEVWRRMLTALDAGAPPAAACRYAGIGLATWGRERQSIPEFGIEADKIEMSGLVAAWRFLQGAAASEWRAALEVVKLYGATRGREVVRVEEQNGDDLDSEVTADDVAAVIRVLRSHEPANHVAGEPDSDGHSNGRAAR